MKQIFTFSMLVLTLASCTTMNKSLREPNSRVEFKKEDFTLSKQVTGEATSVKIIGIDWARIFKNKTGTVSGEGGINALSLSSIPVIGNYIGDKTSAYALHDMMENNQGYDVVFYPQYDTKVSRPFLGLGFIIKKTKVKATARLARLN
jgi:hypothetical protein